MPLHCFARVLPFSQPAIDRPLDIRAIQRNRKLYRILVALGLAVTVAGVSMLWPFLIPPANTSPDSSKTIGSLLFLGGWLSPVSFLPDSPLWLFAKMFCVLVLFFWVRATFPRYRYDQLMRLGWKVFIPVCLIWLVVVACWMLSPWSIWK